MTCLAIKTTNTFESLTLLCIFIIQVRTEYTMSHAQKKGISSAFPGVRPRPTIKENKEPETLSNESELSSLAPTRIFLTNHLRGDIFFGRFVYNGPGYGFLSQSRPVTYQNGFLQCFYGLSGVGTHHFFGLSAILGQKTSENRYFQRFQKIQKIQNFRGFLAQNH